MNFMLRWCYSRLKSFRCPLYRHVNLFEFYQRFHEATTFTFTVELNVLMTGHQREDAIHCRGEDRLSEVEIT